MIRRALRLSFLGAAVALALACGSSNAPPPGAVPAAADAGVEAGPVGDDGGVVVVDSGGDAGKNNGDAARAAFFVTTNIHKIELTVDPAVWAVFMAEHMNLDPNAISAWHAGDVTIDGTLLPKSGFKSFGFGSREANPNKPNLKLDFHKFTLTQTYDGIETLRAKNDGQDVSGLREAITFEALRVAGLMASRTSYAEIFVNGEAYGFYLLEEGFGKDFLRERTGNHDGAVYEADECQGFVPPAAGCAKLIDSYTRPFNPTVGLGEDLAAVCTAINGDPAQFVSAVGALVKLDEWILAVAADTAITGDYDSFSTNGANFRLYSDTTLKRMRLILSGPDTNYDPGYFADPLVPAPSSSCTSSNPQYRDVFLQKLTATPAGLAQYKTAVHSLRTGAMSAATLKARVDAIWTVIGSHVKADPKRTATPDPEAFKDSIKTYLDQRDTTLAAGGM